MDVSADNLLKLNAQEFTAVLRLCGAKNVHEDEVRAAIRSIHEFEETGDKDAAESESEHLTINFEQAVSASFVYAIFLLEDSTEGDTMATSQEKTRKAYQVMKATFDMLDTDGEVSPEELRNAKSNLVGELSYGNEMSKLVYDQKSLSLASLTHSFLTWTLFNEIDEHQMCVTLLAKSRAGSDDYDGSEMGNLDSFFDDNNYT